VADPLIEAHKTNGNIGQARAYLQARLSRFLDRMRCIEMTDQFEWYAQEYLNRGWLTFETRLRVVIPLPSWVPPDLVCSGEVTRIDLVPAGGYAAWLIRSRGAQDWIQELCMPLVQHALAHGALGAPASEIQIGIYSFAEQFVDLCSYSPTEIDQARLDLDGLLRSLGF
jgi:hypothetical protein